MGAGILVGRINCSAVEFDTTAPQLSDITCHAECEGKAVFLSIGDSVDICSELRKVLRRAVRRFEIAVCRRYPRNG